MRDELIALHCAPTCISDYVSHWRTGLNHLASAGHPFDYADSLRHFAKHLPYGSTFDIIRESILFSLSTAQTADEHLLFESIVECIMNVELNQAYFQPSRMRHLNSDPTPTPMSNATKDNTQPHLPLPLRNLVLRALIFKSLGVVKRMVLQIRTSRWHVLMWWMQRLTQQMMGVLFLQNSFLLLLE